MKKANHTHLFQKAGINMLLLVIMVTGASWQLSAQEQREIKGVVTDSLMQSPLPGVTVVVKGTSLGTSTDAGGRYTINAAAGDVLEFSFIGYETQEVKVGERTTVNITLSETTAELEEVVVTALGIEREEKSLTYVTQKVDMQQLTEARELNVMNSLQGKVAGLSVSSGSGGVGAPTRVVLRGNRSISGDSQPLYVVDGVPVRGNPQDLNPDNIASMNILKGPNAAALYGSAAQNGAIVIETKKGQAGQTTVSLNNTFMMLNPDIPVKFQNEYAQGLGGNYDKNSESSWGPRMEGQMVDHWSRNPGISSTQYALTPQPDNKRDVFRNGHNLATNVLVNTGGENVQTAFSYTFTHAQGVLPGNDLRKHNISGRINSQFTDKLRLDSKIEYIRQDIDNRLAEDASNFNPVMQIYRMPANIRTQDARNFEFTNEDGLNRQDYWNPPTTIGANPYWTLNRNLNSNTRDRVLAMTALYYDFTNELTLMLRGAWDGARESSEEKLYNDTFTRAPNGRYTVGEVNRSELNADFLLTYNKTIASDWSLNLNAGGSLKQQRNNSVSANTGPALIIPDFFTLRNAQTLAASSTPGNNVDIHSLYAFAQITWKDGLYVDITGRNDWSSTLPSHSRSYFYPSVGVSAILSDLISGFPAAFSFARLRASWAQVGNDAQPYNLSRTVNVSPGGNLGFLQLNSIIPNANLRPEETVSTELGLDVSFFEGRLGLDATVYQTNTKNQLFDIALPVGSGASAAYVNGGDVQNKGLELLLSGMPVQNNNLQWEVNLNFGLNRNTVREISDERPRVSIANNFIRNFIIEQGEPYGEIYGTGWLRDEQGRVIVGDNGMPQITQDRTNITNFNPDWTGGISNSFSYKGFNASFLIEHRQGGGLVSFTNALLYGDGATEETLRGRDGGLVFGENLFPHETAVTEDGSPNTTEVDAETFWIGVGGRNAPVGEAFVEDASYTRLRELTIGYALPASALERLPFSRLTLSLVGRNLVFLYRASDTLEPDFMPGTGPSSEGFQSFAPPTTRSFGLNLKIDF